MFDSVTLKSYTVDGILQARIQEWVAFSLLQRIFPVQKLNPGLQHCWQILYQQSHTKSWIQLFESAWISPADLSLHIIFLTWYQKSAAALLLSEVKIAQSCPTFCDFIVHGILQARVGVEEPVPFPRGLRITSKSFTSWGTKKSKPGFPQTPRWLLKMEKYIKDAK